MYRLVSAFLLATLAITSFAGNTDNAIALEKRQSVNLSTNGSGQGTSTQFISAESSTTTVTSTGRVTSGGSVIETSSVVTITPSSSVIISVSQVTSTYTPTNSAGSPTGSATVITSASSATYSISYSQVVTSATQQVTTVISVTSNGQTLLSTRTSNTVVGVTTSVRATGSLLAGESSSHSSSGLSDTNKKIIGGVVGGVGGALLLGALAFTAWRIWGNKKKDLHDDELYDPNSGQEKLSASTEANSTPFRSTLDQYHQPGPVNTASNF